MGVRGVSRRAFVRGFAAGAAVLGGHWPGVRAAGRSGQSVTPDVALRLTAAPRRAQLRPGAPTRLWSYRASVLHGDPAAVADLAGNTYLGPVLRLRRGQRLRVDFENRLDEPSIVHWHGLIDPADMDGHPRDAVPPGGHYRYDFTIRNHAGTYWYHPHPDMRTGQQVYFGLAGLLLVSDTEEAALPLPRGEYDVPIVIQDRSFGADNQLRYLAGTGPDAEQEEPEAARESDHAGGGMGMMGGGMMGSGMMGRMGAEMMGRSSGMMGQSGGMQDAMTRMMGFFGDTILVNGQHGWRLDAATHAYRLRLVNASNARIYKLAWSDGRPMTVIATGAGLLAAPQHKPYVMLAPAQRVEVWVDFSADPVGREVRLVNQAFSGSMGMRMGGMPGLGGALGIEGAFPVATVRVARKSAERLALPDHLATVERLRPEGAVNAGRPKVFRITAGGMRWGVNGRSFEMTAHTAEETARLGTTEVWEFDNRTMMAHAMHVHQSPFQVLGRTGGAGEGVADGIVERGAWLDTVLVMPGERVRLIKRFDHYPGLFLYHCHMLEHEDAGLMRNYFVQA